MPGVPFLFKCNCLLKASFKCKDQWWGEGSFWRIGGLFQCLDAISFLSVISKIGYIEIIKITHLNNYFNRRVAFLKIHYFVISFHKYFLCVNPFYPLAHSTCSGIDIYFVHSCLLSTPFVFMLCWALCQLMVCEASRIGGICLKGIISNRNMYKTQICSLLCRRR